MALQKQSVPVNFAEGLDTKTDPKQVKPGKFLSLNNAVFSKGGLLEKRNGFGKFITPPVDPSYLTTFNGNLTAVEKSVYGFIEGTDTWTNSGDYLPLALSTLSTYRSIYNSSILHTDVSASLNNLACTVFTEFTISTSDPTGTYTVKFIVADSVTGQVAIDTTVIKTIPFAEFGTNTNQRFAKVFTLGNYFVIVYTENVAGTYYAKYITINTITLDVDTNLFFGQGGSLTTGAIDGIVYNDVLYIAYANSVSGVDVTTLSTSLIQGAVLTYDAAHIPVFFSLTVDADNSQLWVSYNTDTTVQVYSFALTIPTLLLALSPTLVYGTTLQRFSITSLATAGVLTVYGSINNLVVGYQTPLTQQNTITNLGVVGSPTVFARSVDLASIAFVVDGIRYMLFQYTHTQPGLQNSYFLLNGSGEVVSRVAYQDGSENINTCLSNVSQVNGKVYMAYIITYAIESSGSAGPSSFFITKYGTNLLAFDFEEPLIISAELGNNLNLSGGFLWAYDGLQSVENNFFVYPEFILPVWSTTGGQIAAQPDGATNISAYAYQAIYTWTDNKGNIFNSAPSPVHFVTTTGTGITGSITLTIPTLRLTYKQNVIIQIYRWSVGQPEYHQILTEEILLLNDPTVDTVTYVDTLDDASISAQQLIYTTGGVVENLGAPSPSAFTIFDSRLWMVDAEDPNLLWYSKQVIEATPVEMSDLLTFFVTPSVGSQGTTGSITALSAMDDKLIIFKENAIYYVTGRGPDNTGANSQYSDPIFVTAAVGCENQNSIVLTPNGLMFQSDKGIWLLGRDLSTSYIGSPVERYTEFNVLLDNQPQVISAVSIPDTTEIRFTLSTDIILMYDYYFQQWGTFSGISAHSSTLYQDLHTFINGNGQILQETPGKYLDISNPVTVSFTTGWMNLMGLQGFERAYYFYLLGQFLSPHKLVLKIAYDYNPSPSQQSIISPSNPTALYGDDTLWGSSSPWGGGTDVEQWRIFLQRQKCQAFQISLQEQYDPTPGIPAGAGLTISGLNLVIGGKKSYPTRRENLSVG